MHYKTTVPSSGIHDLAVYHHQLTAAQPAGVIETETADSMTCLTTGTLQRTGATSLLKCSAKPPWSKARRMSAGPWHARV